MAMAKPVAVKCQIFRGGFSGERVVSIQCADGIFRKGMAPTDYCWTVAKRPLRDDEPENGNPIDGYVAARQFDQKTHDFVAVEIPDGEVMAVSPDNVIFPRPEVPSHVPVGP